MKQCIERTVTFMGAITLTLSGCLLLETVSAECALTNQMQGVDGALTLTTMVRQFVMEGTKRCARGQELGFLLRDTSLWGRQLFVGRWFDTILRSMVKAKVSQKSGRFGGEDTNDYFKYVLWETSLSNITATITYEMEFQVTRTEGKDQGETPRIVAACENSIVIIGDKGKSDVFQVLSAIGSDMTNLVRNATFRAAQQAYPTFARLDITYAPFKSRWDTFWPYGFTGRIKLRDDVHRTYAILEFRVVTDYNQPQAADGRSVPNTKTVKETATNYARLYGQVECKILEEGLVAPNNHEETQ